MIETRVLKLGFSSELNRISLNCKRYCSAGIMLNVYIVELHLYRSVWNDRKTYARSGMLWMSVPYIYPLVARYKSTISVNDNAR